jgi:hypothetical protein
MYAQVQIAFPARVARTPSITSGQKARSPRSSLGRFAVHLPLGPADLQRGPVHPDATRRPLRTPSRDRTTHGRHNRLLQVAALIRIAAYRFRSRPCTEWSNIMIAQRTHMPRIRLARGLGRRLRWSIPGPPDDGLVAAPRSEHRERGGLASGPVRISGVHRFGRGLSPALLLDESTGAPGGSSGPMWTCRPRPRANTSMARRPWAIPSG